MSSTVMNGNISLKDNQIIAPLCGTFSLGINKMDKQIAKLHRAIYIWENIEIEMNASIRKKLRQNLFRKKYKFYNFLSSF